MTGTRPPRTLLIAALLLAAAPVAAQGQAWPSHQTISRAEIEAAGWTRVSELVYAVRGLARSSVDGITVSGDAAGLAAWQLTPDAGALTILVDGQPVPLALGGAQVLDLMPVSLQQLDSVTFTRLPAAAAGTVAMHGVLHLHTQRAAGLRASASHYSGNETGDPGPFAFTDAATPNVDNNGPFHHVRLAFGSRGPRAADADIAMRRWTDNLTDKRLVPRYTAAAAPAPPDLWVRHLAPTFRAGLRALGGRHDVHAGVASLDGTFFVPGPQADQSLATELAFAGIGGTIGEGARVRGHYRAHAARLEVAPDEAPLPATLAHVRREVGGAVGLATAAGGVDAAAEVSITGRSLLEAAGSGGLPRTELETDAILRLATAWPLRPAVTASLGAGIAGLRAAAVGSVAHAVTSRDDVMLTAAASRHAAGDGGAWIDMTLLGLEALTDRARTSAAASAAWQRRTHAGIRLEFGGTVRREGGLSVAVPAAPPPGAVVPSASRTSAELRTSVDLPFGGALLGGAAYRFAAPVGGGSNVQAAAEMLPRHLLDASVTVIPFLDIRIRPALHVASGTRWIAPGSATAEVPSFVRVDLSLEKWLLRRHVRGQLIARNLFNDVERYHPLGADFRLRVFAGVTASW